MSHAHSSSGGRTSLKTLGLIWLGVFICVPLIYLLLQYRAKTQPVVTTQTTAVSDSGKVTAKQSEESKRPSLQKRNIFDIFGKVWEMIFPKELYIPPDPNYRPTDVGEPLPPDGSNLSQGQQDSATASQVQVQVATHEDTLYIGHEYECPGDPEKMFSRRNIFYRPVLGSFKRWGKMNIIYKVLYRDANGTESLIEYAGLPAHTKLDVYYIRTASSNEIKVVTTLHNPKKGGKQ